ncbi:RNA ligase family protein [Acidovorax sp. Root217]|uniref:RNA ligase family protein n=1 Tax=Acidovorax sp. Root217 TaxID=1736492 RepID=UPI0007093241|nr:RNA ligase family protein [Acidovorax sp. Root217]KRC23306.1 DNA ligase [Acidovorax sp. Root217]
MTHTFLHNRELAKYPRTPHLQGSRYQPGDKGDPVPYAELLGKTIVVEEKLDAANAGLSFDAAGQLLLQSRGHYLDVDRLGGRERQFNLFKQWARAHEGRLLDVLEDRYVLYGEFMHAKHSVYYDALPHLFCEFDIRDRRTGDFLDTPARHALLAGVPVVSVPVLYAGLAPPRVQALQALLAPSLARTGQWRAAFEDEVARQGLDLALRWQQTDRSELAEGLYIKVEEGGRTVGRFKLVRPDFIQTILDSQSHHSERPVIPNRLRAGVDLFGPEVDKRWPLAGDGRL